MCHQRRYLVHFRNMCIFHRYPIRYGLSGPYLTVACAHFPLETGFTLTSSKGKCTVSNNVLTCASSVSTAATFTVSHYTLSFSIPFSTSQKLTNHSDLARRWASRIQRTHGLVLNRCSERSNSGLHFHHIPCYIIDYSMGTFLIQVSCMRQRDEATCSLAAGGST